MKARLSAVLALILTISFALGGMTSSASMGQLGPPPVELTLGESNDGQAVELEEDELLVLRLESNPSTGYGWGVQQMNPAVLRKLEGEAFEGQSDLLGAPGTQVLRFAGAGRGQTTLTLAYRRSWEAGKPPAKTFSVQVRSKGPFRGRYPPGPAAEQGRTPVLNAEGDAEPAPSSEPGVGASASDAYYNWCDLGGCPTVKNQGSCGSCWAFATVGPLESLILIRDGAEKNLSEQYLVSCNSEGWGCNGGWWAHDYHQFKFVAGESDAGARYEADFPYTASDVPCNPPHPAGEKIVDWQQLAYGVATVEAIKQAIVDYGPVSTAVCVNTAFQSYRSGVFTGPSCTTINHGVVLVGWDDSKGAWRMRNSWGPGWGEDGYMWIGYGVSQIGYRTSYVVYNSGQNVPPTAGFAYDCSGLSCTFTSTSSDLDGTIASHDWIFGDGNTGSGQTVGHTYGAAGAYTVQLTATDNDGATDSSTQSVTVTEPASIHVADLEGGSKAAPRGRWEATVTIVVHDNAEGTISGALVEGAWSDGASGGASCTTDNSGQCSITKGNLKSNVPSVAFSVVNITNGADAYASGDNHDPDGDSNGTTITISQPSENLPPVASFTYTCSDLTCDFTSHSSDPDGSISSQDWDFGDGNTGSGATASHTYAAQGTYSVVLTVADDGGATDTASQSVTLGDGGQVYVFDIDMSGKTAGPNRSAIAVVTIHATGGSPASGATVYGAWNGADSGSVSSVTGSDGTVSFESGKVRQADASFTFTVTDVTHSDYTYDPDLNNETSDSIVVP